MNEVKRVSNVMNSTDHEIKKIAVGFKLRDPEPGEFGSNNLIGEVYYLIPTEEEKPLTWFFGQQEHAKHILWKNCTVDTTGSNSVRSVERVIVDGKYEIDDLELELNTGSVINYSANKFIGHLSLNNENPALLVTSKIKKDHFMEEISDYCKIRTFSELSKFLVFITEQRNENHNFKNEKELVAEVYKKLFNKAPKIRSISSMEEIKSEIWIKLANAGVAIKITDVIKVEPNELYAYFCSIMNIGKMIDGRSFMHMCHQYDTKKVFSRDETLYFGVLSGRHKYEYVFTNGGNISYKIKLNNEYTRFSLSPLTFKPNNGSRARYNSPSYNTSNNDFVDVKEIKESLEKVKRVFGENDSDIIGTHTNIPITSLGKAKLLGPNYVFDNYEKNIYDEDWLSKAKSTLTFENDQTTTVYSFMPSDKQIMPHSVSDLQALRTELIDFYQDHYKDKKNFQIPTGSKEEIISKIADQLQRVYKEIKPSIKAAIKIALGGNFAIQRPYIVESQSPVINFDKVKAKESVLSKKPTQEIFISSELLASTIGLMEAVNDENLIITLSKKFYSKNNDKSSGIKKMASLDNLLPGKKLTTLISVYEQVSTLKNPTANSMLQRFNLDALAKSKFLPGLFTSICIFEMIENRTFLNFGDNPKSVMVQPRDIVKEILDDGMFSTYVLKESIYKNGKYPTKETCLNS